MKEKALPREYVHLTHQNTVTVSDFDRMNPYTVFLCFYRSCNRPKKFDEEQRKPTARDQFYVEETRKRVGEEM